MIPSKLKRKTLKYLLKTLTSQLSLMKTKIITIIIPSSLKITSLIVNLITMTTKQSINLTMTTGT